jgi:hypothetical protein
MGNERFVGLPKLIGMPAIGKCPDFPVFKRQVPGYFGHN